jgi:thiamine biosynthesis protein ThiC
MRSCGIPVSKARFEFRWEDQFNLAQWERSCDLRHIRIR